MTAVVSHEQPSAPDPSKAFRERARWEADRYGSDPWVFVRELLQNARDAGAQSARFTVQENDGTAVVRCLDDGIGMSFEHARRYLFSLYTSSKEGDGSQVGKFGVGFWSVLRFEPSEITVRSRRRDGAAWGLQLSGDLSQVREVDPPHKPGTEIVLRRSGGDGMLARRIRDAAHQNARYLRTLHDPEAPLAVSVNGQAVNEAFELPVPCASFTRGGVRGVVALGPAPRVELFSRGLRVRAAAALEDLLSANAHTDRSRVAFPEIPGGMAPHAILECPELELLLSRGDARDDRQIRKLVRLAQRELERLLDRQLAHARGDGWWQRWTGAAAHRLRHSLAWQSATAVVLGIPLAWLGARMLAEPPIRTDAVATVSVDPLPRVSAAAPPRGPFPYVDLASRYQGPQVDTLDAAPIPFQLTYAPPTEQPYLAALRFEHFTEDGTPVSSQRPPRPYVPVQCSTDCLEIQLQTTPGLGPLRLPIPTGTRLAKGTLRLDGTRVSPLDGPDGLPMINVLPGAQGQLRYAVGPATEPAVEVTPRTPLPDAWRKLVASLRKRPISARVGGLSDLVSAEVAYDRSDAVAERHRRARANGLGLLDRGHDIGAGDCDIQNGVLAALLQAANVPARLAVGIVGRNGGPSPWLHAWVEYQGDDGFWQVVDVSSPGPPVVAVAGFASAPVPLAPIPPAPAESSSVPLDGSAADTTAKVPAALGAPPPPTDLPRWPWVPLALGTVTWLALRVRGRTRRSVVLDEGRDLSALLEGALQHPAAFVHLPGLYTRPLVPTLRGDRVSLRRARELATRGQLYQSSDRTPLAARASKRGVHVVDGGRNEGATVGRAMGAVDLDRWDRLLGRSKVTPLLDAVNAELRRLDEKWCIRQVPEAPGGIASLDVGRLGAQVRKAGASRITLIDALDPVLREANNLAKTRPHTACFMLVDRIAERMRIPSRRRAELLSELASAALEEEAP